MLKLLCNAATGALSIYTPRSNAVTYQLSFSRSFLFPYRYYFKSQSSAIDALAALSEHQAAEDAAQAELEAWRQAKEQEELEHRLLQQQRVQQLHDEENKAAAAALTEDSEGYGWFGGV